MTRSEGEDQLKLVLRNALVLAPPEASRAWVIAKVFDYEQPLLMKLFRPWAIERMLRMADRMERGQPPANQLPIPGLEELPRRIVASAEPPPGKKKPLKVWLKDATLSQLLEYRKVLMKVRDHRLEDLDKLIAFMREHVGKRRNVTVGAVVAEQGKFPFAEAKIERRAPVPKG